MLVAFSNVLINVKRTRTRPGDNFPVLPMPRIVDTRAVESTTSQILNLEWGPKVTHSKITSASLREAPPRASIARSSRLELGRGSGVNHLTDNERAGLCRGRSRRDEQPRTGSPTEEAWAFPDPGVRAYSNALGGCVYDRGRNPRARDRCSGQETTGKPLLGLARI